MYSPLDLGSSSTEDRSLFVMVVMVRGGAILGFAKRFVKKFVVRFVVRFVVLRGNVKSRPWGDKV
jgi:hypothetical protein